MASYWAGFSDEDVKLLQARLRCEDHWSVCEKTELEKKMGVSSGSRVSKTACQSSKYTEQNLNSDGQDSSESHVAKALVIKGNFTGSDGEHIQHSEVQPKQTHILVGCQENLNGHDDGEHSEILEETANHIEVYNQLEALERRRKQMEAENARRKAAIAKAILDRKKRTEAETKKLELIQHELNHLDSVLSGDVLILRNLIEQAAHELAESQKRYWKAEKEFIAAKITLFEKMEKKEKLTGHLCTIIEQAELRKAKKLNELMHELELGPLILDEPDVTSTVLPTLCALNDTSYCKRMTVKQSNAENGISGAVCERTVSPDQEVS